jgi:hypothetical protein
MKWEPDESLTREVAMAKNLDGIKEGFVDGFKYAYNHLSTTKGLQFNGNEIQKVAELKADEHIAMLKQAEEQNRGSKA